MKVLSTNITSPLGYTTEQNYQAVMFGQTSALALYPSWKGMPEPLTAALFSEAQMTELSVAGYTRFESIAIRSIEEALRQVELDIHSDRTLFILSTTKANIEELAPAIQQDGDYLEPGKTARKIMTYFGMKTEPVVVCNACISGVTAQLLARRLMYAGYYDQAIVCGVDRVSPFVVAGFMSFKTLSATPCRPFDIERLGLNLGEAAATIIYGREDGHGNSWRLRAGCLNNDAYHVSAPSPTGDGVFRAIDHVLPSFPVEALAMINAHGTGTLFNDQMESKAIERASLSTVPLSALKGYYGHTLGASGVLETVLSMRALDDGYIVPVRGYAEIGVSGKITLSNQVQKTDKRAFLKIISGFGGCNGVLGFSKDPVVGNDNDTGRTAKIKQAHSVRLTATSLVVDGRDIGVASTGKALLTEIYKRFIGDYPKFYKMDVFAKLVFVASELLIQQERDDVRPEGRAIVFFNASSSVVADRKHLATICHPDGFFPSPSLFLYTLPNIVAGEIAIKHHYQGETSFYILAERRESLVSRIISATFAQSDIGSMMTGWVDCNDENNFEADISILTL